MKARKEKIEVSKYREKEKIGKEREKTKVKVGKGAGSDWNPGHHSYKMHALGH